MRDAMKYKLAKPERVASKCGSVSDGLGLMFATGFFAINPRWRISIPAGPSARSAALKYRDYGR